MGRTMAEMVAIIEGPRFNTAEWARAFAAMQRAGTLRWWFTRDAAGWHCEYALWAGAVAPVLGEHDAWVGGQNYDALLTVAARSHSRRRLRWRLLGALARLGRGECSEIEPLRLRLAYGRGCLDYGSPRLERWPWLLRRMKPPPAKRRTERKP